jgi:PAS domain S-box-containing protein
MNVQAHRHRFQADPRYEQVTRTIRWALLAITLVTFPPSDSRSPLVYGLLGAVTLYNLSRYLPFYQEGRILGSRVTMIAIDNLIVAGMLYLVGNIGTPYTAYLIYMIIAATYWYGMTGTLAVILAQACLLAVIFSNPGFPPLMLDDARVVIISVLSLLAVGLFVERLTRTDREERHILEQLGSENQAERERLTTLINSINDAIFLVDAKGLIMVANGAAQNLVGGYTEIRRKALASVLPLYVRAKSTHKLDLLKGVTGPQHRRDLSLAVKIGDPVDLDVVITPVALDRQKSTNYIIVCRDITKERSLDQQREEFISVASHELRTPLTIVEAALSTALLSTADMTPQHINLLEQAHRNTVFLARLVKDLTTLSEAQNDNLPVNLQPVDAQALLNQLAKDYAAEAKQKSLAIKVIVTPDVSSVLSTEHHIREILQNYLTNALKYTTKGVITLQASPSQNGGVRFSVNDSGVGISESDQKHLFTKFYRAEDFRTRETGGTGLGLYLCLELAERLNAKVWCQSTLNVGSTFYLEVPPFSQLKRDSKEVVAAEVSTLIDQL